MKKKMLLSCIAGALLTLPCSAANLTWTGSSGIDNNWMTPGNWQGGVAPSPGDNLFFQGAAMGGLTTNNNNFPDGTIFGSITIATAELQEFAIGGNRVVLNDGLAESAGGSGPTQGASFVDFDITLSDSQTVTATYALVFNDTIDTAGNEIIMDNTGNVTINGALINNNAVASNGVSLIKTNTGTLTISSTATISPTNPFDVALLQGTLAMDGVASNSTFYLYGGSLIVDGVVGSVATEVAGNISGTGNVGAIRLLSGNYPSVNITPGDNGEPGVLQCNSLSYRELNAASMLEITVNGTTPGTDYSQLLVYGNYDLFDANPFTGGGFMGLAVQWNYTPQLGDSFLVVTQATATPYSAGANGFFSSLAPNSIEEVTNGTTMGISYNSNGVALTTLRTASSPFVLWKGTGAFGSRAWSGATNWAQNVGPTNGAVLVFSPYQLVAYAFSGAGVTLFSNPPVTNDLAGDKPLAALLLTGTNYMLYGNPLTLTGGITNNTVGGTNFCYLNLAPAGPLGLDVEPGGSLLLDDVIAGSGTINKTGAGLLIYTGTTAGAFLGTVAVGSGTLEVDGSFTDGSFTVNGGVLDGTGTVSTVTMTGGTLKPGDSPGILHVQGNLTMATGSAFEAELDGPIPGSGYDQLQVNGSINLNGATLNLQPNFAAGVGAAFLILVNQGANSIAGTFAGLPEGAIFEAGGQYFSISYQAGSGNKNVVVTVVNRPGNLTSIVSLPPTAVQLLGTGATNATYNILANTNPATTNWENIGTVNANGSGLFFFNDSNVLLFPQRFYQIQAP